MVLEKQHLYIIAGLIKPDNGKVNIGKTDITNYPVYERARNWFGLSASRNVYI